MWQLEMNMNRKYYEALYAYFKENQEEELLSLTYLEGKRVGEKYLVKASETGEELKAAEGEEIAEIEGIARNPRSDHRNQGDFLRTGIRGADLPRSGVCHLRSRACGACHDPFGGVCWI